MMKSKRKKEQLIEEETEMESPIIDVEVVPTNIKISNAYIQRVLSRDAETGEYIDPVISSIVSMEKPFKFEYWLTRFFDLITLEAERFSTARNKVVTKHAIKDNDGSYKVNDDGNYTFTQVGSAKLNEDFAEFMNTEIEILMKPIVLDIDDPDMPKLNNEQMKMILPILEPIDQ